MINQTRSSGNARNRASLDVCIVCALGEEAQAFLRVVEERYHLSWSNEINSRYGYSYRLATIRNAANEPLNIHISWLPRYGPEEMLWHLRQVIEEYQPHLAIMTGICAGDKAYVKLGDLVVAERTFACDHGKMIKDEFGRTVQKYDTMTYQIYNSTLQFLRLFDHWEPLVANLARPVSKRQQREWLLDRLFVEPSGSVEAIPLLERETYAPTWRLIVHELQQGPEPFLTPVWTLRDKAMVKQLHYQLDPFPFRDPHRARRHFSPLASGSAVRSDNPFKEIQIPVHGAVAVDMEGAAFGRVMENFRHVEWLIVKGVSDYADQDKDDSYHEYAGRASAMYALCFIEAYITRQRFPASQLAEPSSSTASTGTSSQDQGLLALEKGKKALWNASYPLAKRELRKAIEGIDSEHYIEAASQARYFLALALLEGKVPRIQENEVIQSIERLMNEAIHIHPYASYYRVLARIKWDYFEFNGAKHRVNEVLSLGNEANAYDRCKEDEEHEEYFLRTQPRLQL